MTQALPDLAMQVEVVGCPTVCLHCWAMGRPYQAMPLEEISWVLHEVRRFCTTHQLSFSGYPMHEVLAHPQAGEVLVLFQQLWEVAFDPLPTTGVPLATRPDWREILAPLRSYCVPMLWFAFHGTSEVHDRMVQRKGAYQESLRAVALAREAQVHTGCTLFLTSENVSHFDQLVADLLQAGMQTGLYASSQPTHLDQEVQFFLEANIPLNIGSGGVDARTPLGIEDSHERPNACATPCIWQTIQTAHLT